MSKAILHTFVVALFLGTGLSPALASAAEDPRSEVLIDELASRLNLTDEQRTRIAPALEQRNERMRDLLARRDSSARPRQRIALAREAKGIQDDFVNRVNPVLTKEQQAEWKRLREEMRGRLKERAR
jgi:hypothetical protein